MTYQRIASEHNDLRDLVEASRRVMKPCRASDLPDDEKAAARWQIARAVESEIRDAYVEQTSLLLQRQGTAPNYRLTLDDVLFAQEWTATLRYDALMAAWESDPDNRAAAHTEAACETANARAQIPDAIKKRLEARPKRPERRVTLANAPRGWPASIVSWSEGVDAILSARREMAGAKPAAVEREPGEDVEDVA